MRSRLRLPLLVAMVTIGACAAAAAAPHKSATRAWHEQVLAPALCDLPIRGAALTAADLRVVLSRGTAPGGFGAAAAIAQAYDAVCGRPSSQSFRQAVTQGSAPPCETGKANAVPCCPPNAMCLPPPCPPCPRGAGPCPAPVAAAVQAALAC